MSIRAAHVSGALLSAALVAGCGGVTSSRADEPRCCQVVLAPVESGEIRGEVVAHGDLAARGLVVRLRGAPEVPPLEARPSDAGRFFFGPVPPGDYELVVAEGDEALWRERVHVDDGASLLLTIEVSPST
jgi:hypothetical protein